MVHGVPGSGRSSLLFTTCALPGRTYLSALWFSIVNSGDPKHLASGTQVKALHNTEEAMAYATAYASKATQKLTPDGFVGVLGSGVAAAPWSLLSSNWKT